MKPEELGAYYESILEKEVRKECGIYYTPPYIVDYIVKNTVGRLLEDKTPKESVNIKIVDPACGAGIFLLGAYQYLLDWYTKHSGKLTLAKRRKILTKNIFGIDIDPLAVEITKYCLSMRCTGDKDFSCVLDNNIKIGNSLIDIDYYENELDFGEERKIKPFSWQKNFPEVFKQGGFDCVIGNPPYVDSEEMVKTNRELRNYAIARYETAKGNWDMYCIYTEKAISLLRYDGNFGFIIPSKFLSAPYGQHLKKFVSNYCIYNIEDYTSVSVFAGERTTKTNVYPIILLVNKTDKISNGIYNKYLQTKDGIIKTISTSFQIGKQESEWNGKFSKNFSLLEKIKEKSSSLSDSFIIENSATVNEAYIIKEFVTKSKNKSNELKLVNTGTAVDGKNWARQ